MAQVKDILRYSSEEWIANQAEMVQLMIRGRQQLGLSREWVAGEAGYSITQYQKLEEGSRFLEMEDFLRIGVVFYKYQESLSPAYVRLFNKLKLKVNTFNYLIRYWLEGVW